jgi:hypothetical protein
LAAPVEEVVGDINLFLRGWAGYFRYGNSAHTFDKICECRCGAPGWRTTRLGAGDRGVTRTRSGRFGVPFF